VLLSFFRTNLFPVQVGGVNECTEKKVLGSMADPGFGRGGLSKQHFLLHTL